MIIDQLNRVYSAFLAAGKSVSQQRVHETHLQTIEVSRIN
jgi:hypothetical protein